MQVIIWAKYGLVYVNDNLISYICIYYDTTIMYTITQHV